jgi:rare lipoprotein A
MKVLARCGPTIQPQTFCSRFVLSSPAQIRRLDPVHRLTLASQQMSRTTLATVVLVLCVFAAGCAKKKVRTAKPPRIGSSETGIASWYGHPYHGRRAANGEVYDMEKMTAAHRTLPFDTWVRVENLDNNKQCEVRIQDRGPFIDGRIIDLSRAAARSIDMIGPGIVKVKVTIIPPPPYDVILASRTPYRAPQPVREVSPAPVPAADIPASEEVIPPPPPPVASSQLFAVQVGAFRHQANAERIRRSMEERFGRARLVFRDAGRPVWRVLVGEEGSAESAEELAGRIRETEREAFVVRLDEPRPSQ